MSKQRRMTGGFCSIKNLPKGPNGRNLCRWCSKEVPKGRRSYCGDACVDEWRIRTDPAFVRRKVFERDHGICEICAIDTIALQDALRHMQWDYHSSYRYVYRQLMHDHYHHGRTLFAKFLKDNWLAGWDHAWDADHIHPVIEGGGECGLEGYRTLCVRCHKAVTRELRWRLSKK